MTKQTRATFLSALATLINDNTTLDVSPADVRNAITDLADSAAFIDDELEVEANNQTGTSYTLVLADAWKQVRMDNAGANTLTVPPNASVAFETGTVVWVEQAGAGTTSVAAGAGVTINTPDDLALVENQTVRLLKVGTDEWTMTDDSAGGGSSVTKATAADIRAGTLDAYVTADGVESAAEEVTLTDAATVAVDWSTFINGNVTLAGNRTLGAPSNGEPGTSRKIRVIQDGTGSRTLAFNAVYKFPGGAAPILTTTASAVDVLEIYCVSTSVFYVFSQLDMS